MTVFGVDISHHQGDFDLGRARAEGIRFAYCKVTEGTTFRDDRWHDNRDAARTAGLYLAGYHFLRSDTSQADQAMNLARHIGDPRIPVIVDCEPSGTSRPSIAAVRRFIAACEAFELRCSMLYLPRWYWRDLGTPPLDGLPPLIQSNYGENPVGPPAGIYPGDTSDRWAYDGLPVTVLQFGDNGVVAGRQVDVNAYRGPVRELGEWFQPPKENTMAAVSKVIDVTADIGNAAGEVVLNGEIPDGWSDYVGSTATMSSPDGWVASVRRTGEDQLTVRCLRRDGNDIEPVPVDTQVSFTVELHGQD